MDDDAEIAESGYDGFLTRQSGLYKKIDELQNAGLLDAGRKEIGRAWSDESTGHLMSLGKEAIGISDRMKLFYKFKVRNVLMIVDKGM